MQCLLKKPNPASIRSPRSRRAWICVTTKKRPPHRLEAPIRLRLPATSCPSSTTTRVPKAPSATSVRRVSPNALQSPALHKAVRARVASVRSSCSTCSLQRTRTSCCRPSVSAGMRTTTPSCPCLWRSLLPRRPSLSSRSRSSAATASSCGCSAVHRGSSAGCSTSRAGTSSSVTKSCATWKPHRNARTQRKVWPRSSK